MGLSISTFTAVALSFVVLGTVSACAAPTPTPTPTVSDSSACTPKTATISWQPKTQVDDVEIGHFVTVVGGDLASETKRTAIDPAITLSPDVLSRLARGDQTTSQLWQTALLDDVRRTGQVFDTFGRPSTMASETPATAAVPKPGIFVTDVWARQFQLQFSVACVGTAPVAGSLTAAESGGTTVVFIECGVAVDKPNPMTERAATHCPVA